MRTFASATLDGALFGNRNVAMEHLQLFFLGAFGFQDEPSRKREKGRKKKKPGEGGKLSFSNILKC